MSYLIFSRNPQQEGELPILGKGGPQVIRFYLSHPEPGKDSKPEPPVIRVEFRVPVGESMAYGALILSIPEAKVSGLLDYEPLPEEGFVHKNTGIKVKTLQMDTPTLVMKVAPPAEGKSYYTITEVGYDQTPRFKSWGNYSKRTERPVTGSAFASLLAKARGGAEPQTPEPAPEPAPEEDAPPPTPAKRRRVAI
jgi:hypothetical protein